MRLPWKKDRRTKDVPANGTGERRKADKSVHNTADRVMEKLERLNTQLRRAEQVLEQK